MNAFAQAMLSEDVYVELPRMFEVLKWCWYGTQAQ